MRGWAAFALPFTMFATSAVSQELPVDVELVLLVDVSGSIDEHEYALQKAGYLKAFQSAELIEAVRHGPTGRLAVTYVEWDRTPRQMVGWHLVHDMESARTFAAAIASAPRHISSGSTGLADALLSTPPLFHGNGFAGARTIVDVSGDGAENTGADAAAARDLVLSAGISAINAIVVTVDDGPKEFYHQDVAGGSRSFLMVSEDFAGFEDAIRRKLVLEISSR